MPGLTVGQRRDCRYPAGNGEGLHAHVHDGFTDLHLDSRDACVDAVAHGVADTRVLEGAAVGGIALTILGALVGGKRGAAVGAGVGVLAGGGLGLATPRRSRPKVVELAALLAPRLPA